MACGGCTARGQALATGARALTGGNLRALAGAAGQFSGAVAADVDRLKATAGRVARAILARR